MSEGLESVVQEVESQDQQSVENQQQENQPVGNEAQVESQTDEQQVEPSNEEDQKGDPWDGSNAPKWVQKKINKQTAEIHRLRGQIEAMQRINQPDEAQQAIDYNAPRKDNYDTDDEYIQATVKYQVQQVEQQRKRIESQRRFEESVQTARDKYDDWDEVMAYASSVPYNSAMIESIKEADNSPDVLYHLVKNPNIASKIALMDPLKTAVEIGKLSTQFNKQAQQQPVKQKQKTSKAPPPINPVKPTGEVDNFDPYNATPEEYMKWRAKQKKK